MAFGWGPGDVVQAVKFIAEVASALDDVDGAGKDFRQASSFLRNLDEALRPFQLKNLEVDPLYKVAIEKHVAAIRKPIEKFMNDVQGLEKKLGEEPQARRWRHLNDLRHVPQKLEWHYFTSKRALALQKEIDQHIQIIDTWMQRLTVEMLDNLKAGMKNNMKDSISESMPLLRETIANELSKDDRPSYEDLIKHLESMFERYLGPQKLGLHPAFTIATSISQDTYIGDLDGNAVYTAEMMQTAIAHWHKRFFFEQTGEEPDPLDSFPTDAEVADSIRQWWTSDQSQVLWVHGLRSINDPSLAASMNQLARNTQIPTVMYNCKTFNPEEGMSRTSGLFVNLIYSLIYQIVQSLPAEFVSTLDFGPSRFALLQGDPSSITAALALLEDLLSLEEKRQLIILDDFEELDYSGDKELESHVQQFLHMLQSDEKVLLKTLITTEEQAPLLLEEVDAQYTIDASRSIRMNGYLGMADFV